MLARGKRIEALRELAQSPRPRQRDRLGPTWRLIAPRWQRRPGIHDRDRTEKPQLLRLCGESAGRDPGVERAVAAPQRGGADRPDAPVAGGRVRTAEHTAALQSLWHV